MTSRGALVWLTLILLLGGYLRFASLTERSLWEDEGWTLLLTEGDSLSEVVQTIAYDQHPPLYFILFYGWRGLTGESELAFRALSLLTSLLSIAAMYQLGRTAYGVRVGVLAAALLSVWDFSIDLAQDARQYTQLTLFVILSSYFYLRYARRPNRRDGLGWFLASVAVLYTQYVGGVVLAVQAVHALLTIRPLPRLANVTLRFALIGLAFAPWLPIFYRQNQVRWDDPIYYQSALENTHATFILIRDAMVTQQPGLVVGLALLGLVAIAYSAAYTSRGWRVQWRESWQVTAFLLAWVVVYCGLFVYLNEGRPILRIRIFAVVMPPLLVLVAHGVNNFQTMPRRFLIAVLLITQLTTLDTRQNHVPWREVTANVSDYHLPGEPVLMDIWVGDFPVRYYIGQQMGAEWLSLRELRREAGDLFLPYLVGYVQGYDAFWLIRWGDDPADYDGLLAENGFQRTASRAVEHVGNRIYAHRYDRLSDTSLATFGETLRLIKAAVIGEVAPGENITVTLWWTAVMPPPLDYSISIRLQDSAGNTITNWDAPPLTPTSTWGAGQIQYDARRLTLPDTLPENPVLAVSVYWYADPENPLLTETQRIAVPVWGE